MDITTVDSLVNGVNHFTNYNPIYKSNTLDSSEKQKSTGRSSDVNKDKNPKIEENEKNS